MVKKAKRNGRVRAWFDQRERERAAALASAAKKPAAKPKRKKLSAKNPGWLLVTRLSSAAQARAIARDMNQQAKSSGDSVTYKAGKSGGVPAVLRKRKVRNAAKGSAKRSALEHRIRAREDRVSRGTATKADRDQLVKLRAALSRSNPPKLKRVTKSSGWLKADAVKFVKKGRKVEVYLRRNKKPRRK